jgi:hypothetical protein
MPRFYSYRELIERRPIPLEDISRLAAEVARLPPFLEGVAVLCGSIAWGRPAWRSDIDVIAFATESFPDISPAIRNVIEGYDELSGSRSLLPNSDVIVVGEETQKLVTRKNLVRGSAAIEELQTVREIFAAASLRFFNHIGSLATIKGEPWRTFHATYLSDVRHDRQSQRDGIRSYVTAFADQWRQRPLALNKLDQADHLQQRQLDIMGHVENFPIHLMRQILAERGLYPSPDRALEVCASFSSIPDGWAQRLFTLLDPFLLIGQRYESIVRACMDSPPITINEYYGNLMGLFDPLSFDDAEEAVWSYLGSTS